MELVTDNDERMYKGDDAKAPNFDSDSDDGESPFLRVNEER